MKSYDGTVTVVILTLFEVVSLPVLLIILRVVTLMLSRRLPRHPREWSMEYIPCRPYSVVVANSDTSWWSWMDFGSTYWIWDTSRSSRQSDHACLR